MHARLFARVRVHGGVRREVLPELDAAVGVAGEERGGGHAAGVMMRLSGGRPVMGALARWGVLVIQVERFLDLVIM